MQKYLIILFFIHTQLFAQSRITLVVEAIDTAGKAIAVDYGKTHADTITMIKELQRIQLSFAKRSFITNYFETVQYTSDSVYAKLLTGPSYKWVKLNIAHDDKEIFAAAGFRESDFNAKRVDVDKYNLWVENVLQYLERNGYPFASLSLTNMQWNRDELNADVLLERNNFIVFDSIEIVGNAQVKKWFIEKYLGVKKGSGYNELLINKAESRLSQLPFISSTRNAAVYFYGNKAKPIIFADDRKSSSVDGIIGFAPNTQSNNNELLITGEANLKLQNLFSTGKTLDINYRSFLGNSQDLKVKFVFPYLFKSNIGVDYDLHLLKQDTTFLDTRNQIGIQYRFIGTDHIRFFYSIQSTTLITVDTTRIKQTRTLPDAADVSVNQYGISLKLNRYDYFYNPRKGFSTDLSIGVGTKKIMRNPTIDGIRIASNDGTLYSIYDSVQLNMIQYRIQGDLDVFLPLYKLLVFRTQLMGGHLQAPQLFFNDLYRIGGIRTLKGFDEQSIFANSYLIANLELRYLLQQNAHVMVFWNGAYYENKVRVPKLTDTPYGFGAGLNFETGAGIFSIYYALGKSFNNPIEFGSAKVHFGFINYF